MDEAETETMSSPFDDPLLKELLKTLKEDTQRMASDLLSVITTQALIAVFALFLAVASIVRIILFEQRNPFNSGPGPIPGLFETALTFVLFALSVVSICNLLRLRERYLRLQALAEKLGR